MLENCCALFSVNHWQDWFGGSLGVFHLAAYHFEEVSGWSFPSSVNRSRGSVGVGHPVSVYFLFLPRTLKNTEFCVVHHACLSVATSSVRTCLLLFLLLLLCFSFVINVLVAYRFRICWSLSDVTSKFCIAAEFVIVPAQTQFLTKCLGLFVVCLQTKRRLPCFFSGSLVTVRATFVASAEEIVESAKAQVNLSPSTPWRHVGGSRGIAPLILNLSARWRWVFNVTSRELYPPRKELPGTIWIGRWMGPGAGLDVRERRKMSCTCRDAYPGPSSP
jgi:hypothetical protein